MFPYGSHQAPFFGSTAHNSYFSIIARSVSDMSSGRSVSADIQGRPRPNAAPLVLIATHDRAGSSPSNPPRVLLE